MTCPPIPIEKDRWNLWLLSAKAELDGEDVVSFVEDALDDADGTAGHDFQVEEWTTPNAFPPNADATTWRRTQCDPLPMLDAGPSRQWVVRFVARGTLQGVPVPSSGSVVPEFAFLDTEANVDVPNEPPGFFERIGTKLEKGAKHAMLFYGALAFFAVYVAVKAGKDR